MCVCACNMKYEEEEEEVGEEMKWNEMKIAMAGWLDGWRSSVLC